MAANMIRLHRQGLIAARLLWIVLAPTTLLYLIAGLPRLLIYYDLPCEADFWPNCAVIESGLRFLGLNWHVYAWYSVVWVAAICVPNFVVCGFLAWRKKDNSTTLLFLIALLVALVMNVNYDLPSAVARSYPASRVAVFILYYCGQISPMVLYVFPDGHFVSRWVRWMAILFAVLNLVVTAITWWPLPIMNWLNYVFEVILWGIYPLSMACMLLYRYRQTASPEQRQQIKWVVWAVALMVSVVYLASPTIVLVIHWFDWSTSIPIWYAVFETMIYPTVYYSGVVLGFLGFYVAIFRYQLWDIDLFINRSLVYGGLTALLGSVLVGVFVATQTLLDLMAKGIQVGAASIISVIVVIVLFAPVKDRLQRFVDSRFYGVDPDRERAVQAAIAQERDRLSCELHDSVTQSLYGLTIMAESCQRLARDGEAIDLAEPLVEMGDVARQALKEMRLLIHELRPPVLAEEGLLSALHQRLAAVERRSGIEANLMIDKVVDLPALMEEALYHITIEALNNIIKHAAATSVSLSLRTGETGVEMEIVDDGKGFDPASEGGKGGMGLASMRKRAEELGGTLNIHPVPGQGTKVTVRIPFHADQRKHGA